MRYKPQPPPGAFRWTDLANLMPPKGDRAGSAKEEPPSLGAIEGGANQHASREASSQEAGSGDITERIGILAAQGLKPRDISSLLHIHPLMVVRVLERARGSL